MPARGTIPAGTGSVATSSTSTYTPSEKFNRNIKLSVDDYAELMKLLGTIGSLKPKLWRLHMNALMYSLLLIPHH